MKEITLTLILDDTRIINEDDNIEDIKDKMLSDMFEYMSSMTFGNFCNNCDIEIEESKEALESE